MVSIALLKNYNNYFNRKVKFERNLTDYLDNYDYRIIDNVNFNVRDGVNTSHVCIMNEENNFVPDYLLVVNSYIDVYGEQKFEILSRWFIMEWTFLAGTQYTATLRNDVIANNIERIYNAPVILNRANIHDPTNPLIFNSEGLSFNEIKTKEILLKDKTKIGWLVGYMVQQLPDNETEKKFTAEYSYIEGSQTALSWEDIDNKIKINYDSSGTIKKTYGSINNYKMIVRGGTSELFQDLISLQMQKGDFGQYFITVNKADQDGHSWFPMFSSNNSKVAEPMKKWAEQYKSEIITKIFNPKFKDEYGALTDDEIQKMNGVLFTGPDGKLYNLEISNYRAVTHYHRLEYLEKNKQTFQAYRDLVSKSPTLKSYLEPYYPDYYNVSYLYLSENVNEYIARAVPAEAFKKSIEVTVKNTRNHLGDAPYDMFCIPFDKDNIEKTAVRVDDGLIYLNNIISLVMAKGMAVSGGGLGTANTYIYDIQYLPYCPIPELKAPGTLSFSDDGTRLFDCLTVLGFEKDKDYSLVYNSNDLQHPISILFWATKRSGTFNIEYKKQISNDPIDIKISNETEKLRLCSPNYAGLFEFIPAKNRGVDFINVDFTYKPMNPYIHLNPNFKGLYGSDFNDSRGLIIGGDFSLETLSDKFLEYELRNKNYSQMFDREIQNMDINNSINLTSQSISTAFNSIAAGVAGGAMGAKAGGPVGAAVGGAVAGVGSLVGGVADIALGQKGYRESRDFKTDMFNFNLGNIKALPRSLSKTSAFTFNHKVFPFIEEYDCTDVEKEALRNKIKYNGMNIGGVIARLGDYATPSENHLNFVQGQIVRLDEIADDNHVAQAIYEEIDKGVFF